MTRSARTHVATAIVLVGIVSIGSPLLAQPPLRVTMPGAAFSAEGRGDDVTVDEVAGGKRFRGKGFAKVIVKATLQLPPSSSADPKMQRLVVHFRTSPSGPSVRSVELRNGGRSEFHLQTHLAGDYTVKETTQPESAANAWDFQRGPVRVYPQSVIRLEVQFPGGFDSQINPGEFVLTSVVVDFPRRPTALSSTTTGAAVITSAAGVSTGAAGVTTGTTVTAGVGRGRGRLVEPAAGAVLALATASAGVIYALTTTNDLLWYRHDGRDDGAARWAAAEGKAVGSGWTFKHVFPGGDGVIYAITDTGDLLWYRHDGRGDGSFRWAASAGRKVGTGWNFKHVFSGGDGVIYAITDTDELLWYRHDGRGDGSFRWAAPEGRKVGTGWTFKHVFSGGDGVIYAITGTDDLLWYRHDGRNDGSFRWAASEGRKVGSGWTFKHVFPGADGVIYAVAGNDDLLWYRHEGRADGSVRWTASAGRKVGSGWTFKDIF